MVNDKKFVFVRLAVFYDVKRVHNSWDTLHHVSYDTTIRKRLEKLKLDVE